MLRNAKLGKELPIYGDGLNVRDWLYVDDHCEAIDLIVRNAKDGAVYNIGGNNEKSNLEIVKLILNEVHASEKLIKHIEDRKGHDRRYAIDASLIKKELGWSPKFNFDEAIKSTIDWYMDNSEWVESIVNKDYLEFNAKHYGD